MARRLSVTVERFPLASAFTISRGSKTEAVVVHCRIADDSAEGVGECVPYPRYGETPEGVAETIEGLRAAIEAGAPREELQTLVPAGAARNAVDCALWDLEAKRAGRSVAELIGLAPMGDLETAYTISLGSADEMSAQTRAAADRPVLKIKVGAADGNDPERMRAVRAAAPNARLIIDANEGWRADTLTPNLLVAASVRASLVEQPLPAGEDASLAGIPHPVPVCADESVHATADLASLRDRYDYVNLKLDKTGGLTEGLAFARAARKHGFGLMVGCMVGTSLSMAPALVLAQGADFVDLDGPLLLKHDRENALSYRGSIVSPPRPSLWG